MFTIRMRGALPLFVLATLLLIASESLALTMYGALGPLDVVGQTGPPGSLLIVDQTDASITEVIGDAVTPGGLSGIAFNSVGQLFGSTRQGGGVPGSDLVLIDPDSSDPSNPGAPLVTSTIGPIQDGTGADIGIGDLTFQPGTNVLFGVSTFDTGIPCPACLYTIDTTTAGAMLVGDSGLSNGGLAFAPDGTLYLVTNDSASKLVELNPEDSSVVPGSTVPVVFNVPFVRPRTGEEFFSLPVDGLAVRPSDGILFATLGLTRGDIVTFDPNSGDPDPNWIRMGDTLVGPTTDLDFRPEAAAVPEPSSLLLLGSGLAGLAGWRWRQARLPHAS